MPPRARSSLCARVACDGFPATKPPDGGDTNSAPSADLFECGPSRNRLSNPGRGHDGASNPKLFPAEHPAWTGPRVPAQSERTQCLQQYVSYSTHGYCQKPTHRELSCVFSIRTTASLLGQATLNVPRRKSQGWERSLDGLRNQAFTQLCAFCSPFPGSMSVDGMFQQVGFNKLCFVITITALPVRTLK